MSPILWSVKDASLLTNLLRTRRVSELMINKHAILRNVDARKLLCELIPALLPKGAGFP